MTTPQPVTGQTPQLQEPSLRLAAATLVVERLFGPGPEAPLAVAEVTRDGALRVQTELGTLEGMDLASIDPELLDLFGSPGLDGWNVTVEIPGLMELLALRAVVTVTPDGPVQSLVLPAPDDQRPFDDEGLPRQ